MDARAAGLARPPLLDIEPRPSREEAEAAVRTLIRWAGDNSRREGLRDTPSRVLDAYEEWFQGYREDPIAILDRTFSEVAGYLDMVLLRDIEFVSHCEHHMAPIIGRAHVAYSGWPIGKRELDPYYARAHQYCHLGAYSYDTRESLPQGPAELIPGLHSAQVQTVPNDADTAQLMNQSCP